ncbi:glycosyltransferase [Nostocaceae cyanobacterium CENA357]|uniref:Glycosyltransferase n=1 Tax=Atlanticothrix silvestris CENA357 TaxID=1725252 RepID=A0A8J7HHE5_9CYAN|nr:glycosyltransferase [Atlanticothrix silvestris]MBH8555312.1 glycosyltransferase [Atlanticothrix silvestris CENA357]
MKTNTKQLRVCQVVASINEVVGGPAYSVTNLAQSLSELQICSHLFTLDYQNAGKQVPTINVNVHSYSATKLAKYLRGFQPSANYALQQIASCELDLIHNHGLWMFPNLYARQAAVNNNLPLIISPRGMLESWSLRNSWFKKLPAWYLYEQQNLQKAIAFHATSDEEAKSIRQLNFRQPIALIPNGVSLPNLSNLPNREILFKQFPEITKKKWLLFLSRIHPKKGIDNLLYVWKKLITQFPDWHLIIAGPDLIGYQAKLEQLTAQLELQPRVTFTGMLSGEQKASALCNADLFVLPTHSENFGIAIAESLAYGVPVITTKGAPWKDLEGYGCGWWIEDNQQALMDVLIEAIEMPESQRQAMGLKGRNLVETKYSWSVIAKDMASVYHWILNGGSPPSCIQVNE